MLVPDLSSAAREAAHVEAKRRYGVGVEPVIRRVGFEAGAEWCASLLPSEEEIARALAVADGQVLSGLTDHMLDFMYGAQARGVLSLIGEKING